MKTRNIIITNSQDFKGEVDVEGTHPETRQDDVAIRTQLKGNEIVTFNKLNVRNCGIPLRHDSGMLFIEELTATNFTADLLNCAGDLLINKLIVDVDGSKLKYSDRYHMDALGQFFAPKNQTVSFVRINSIEARIKGDKVQGMMLSEGRCKYSYFTIGKDKADIEMDYKYAFMANQLERSYINVGKGGVRIVKRKASKYNTHRVEVENHKDALQVFDANLLDQKQVVLVNKIKG